MPMDPNEVMSHVQKADAALSELVTNGGYISERELPTFLRQQIKMAQLTAKVRRQLMDSEQLEIPRLRFPDGADDFVLYPLTENAGHPVSERSKPTFGALNLTSTWFGGQVNISKQIRAANVEKDRIIDTIRSAVYPKIGADVEKIGIRGDTTSAIPSLAALDGWLVQATAHTVAGGGNRLTDTYLASALRALPEEYDMGDVAYMTSKKAKHDWLDSIKSRATDMGDATYLGKDGQRLAGYRGYPVEKYPLWPSTQGGTNDRTTVLYTEHKNLVLGLFQDIKLRVGESLETRQTMILFDVAIAVGFEVDDAVVAITDILNS